jgi:hypothetical protein
MITRPSSRRGFLTILVSIGLSILAPGHSRGAIKATPDAPACTVIDMHTHVFNARDLPLFGILVAKGAPRPVAVVVADAILSSMQDEDEGDFRTEVNLNEIDRPLLRELSSLERNILQDFIGRDRIELLGQVSRRLEVKLDVVLVAETMAEIGFPPGEGLAETIAIKTITAVPELADGLKGFIRFIGIMTKQHGQIVRVLELKYPQVDLFVHHMMDMATGYDDNPSVLFDKQLAVMQKLDETFPGKLLHFTAFDPFRRTGALPLTDVALKNFSAVGWKIYPPSGYRAAENAKYGFPPKPPWMPTATQYVVRRQWDRKYKDWTPQELDQTLQGGFSRAGGTPSIPIFTHCTPGGFEAAKGYGKMADPNYWAAALADSSHPGNAALRLCFGHSGGEAYWFSDPGKDSGHAGSDSQKDPWQFGSKVVELCQTYENVYCEVGYLNEIAKTQNATWLTQRLEKLLEEPSKNGKWKFGDKIMYGTDWHMMIKEKDYEKYLGQWDDVMKKVQSGKWRQAFFASNAKKFLQLDQLANDSRFTKDQQRELDKLSKAIP